MIKNRLEIIQLMNEIYNDFRINKKDTSSLKKQLMQEYSDYMKQNPQDTNMRLHYIIGLNLAFGSIENIVPELLKIFLYEPYNPYAVILYAHEQFTREGITEETLDRLEKIDSNDPQIISLTYLYIAYYYEEQCNDKKYEEYLLKSIEIYSGYPQHYFDLAEFYEKETKLEQAKKTFIQALSKIIGLTQLDTPPKDIINLDAFFDHHIKNLYPYEHMVNEIKLRYNI